MKLDHTAHALKLYPHVLRFGLDTYADGTGWNQWLDGALEIFNLWSFPEQKIHLGVSKTVTATRSITVFASTANGISHDPLEVIKHISEA